jgi:signal transduction histidine kinase
MKSDLPVAYAVGRSAEWSAHHVDLFVAPAAHDRWSVSLIYPILATALIAGLVVGALITFWFVRLLRRMIASLEVLDPGYKSPAPGFRLKALIDAFERRLERAAAARRALQRSNAELEFLAAITHALNRASSVPEMLDIVLEQTFKLLPYERAYIALANQAGEPLRLAASRGYALQEQETLPLDEAAGESTAQDVRLPLRASAGVIGFLDLDTPAPSPKTRRLLHLLAEALATAIEKHRLIETTQREVRSQRLLNEAGRVLTSTLDKQEVLTRIMREVTHTLNAQAGSVLLIDEEQGDMYFAAAASPAVDLLLGTRMALDQGIVGWAVQRREPVLVADAYNDPRFYGQVDQQTGLNTRSVLCVPLVSKERVIGAIEVIDSRREMFTLHDLRILESLAPQAAIAIVNASLHESLKEQMDELQRTQAQLLQAEKLSAIGQLVAGVAHELNNPLTAIVGYSQLLIEMCHDPEIVEDLKRIDNEAQRSARIVQNLLAFARQQKLEKRPLNLGEVLNKTLDLLAYQLQVDNIRLERELPPEPLTVLGDTYQLQQVFLNLITNAHQAMRKTHGSGTLTVRIQPGEKDTVQILFIDDGPGIQPEIISRIFDPFFTTKDVGEGTGLGLSICLGIVQEHQGRIWAESEPEQGATFVVELPLYEDQPRAVPTVYIVTTPSPAQKRKVLVVDDEVEIVRLLTRVLQGEGHQVTTATNGYEARSLLDEHTFDLVICDLKMPGMSGRELYEHLQQTRPDMARRVIFSTGDVVSTDSWSFLQKAGNHYISKPFKPEQILAAIEQMRV